TELRASTFHLPFTCRSHCLACTRIVKIAVRLLCILLNVRFSADSNPPPLRDSAVNIHLRDRRQWQSNRHVWSSSFPTRSPSWSQKLPAPLKRPSRPEAPPAAKSRQNGPSDGSPKADRQWQNELSPKSRLCSIEHEKEHHHAEAAKRINERREQHYRRNQAPQEIEEVEDELPHLKSRHQNCADQCQQRSVFECHGRSMNVAGVSRNIGSSLHEALRRG